MRVKKKMIKVMDFVMLDCNRATYLVTKDMDGELSCFERMRLKLHLKTCDFCYKFYMQNIKIDMILKQRFEELEEKYICKHRLDNQKNEKLSTK